MMIYSPLASGNGAYILHSQLSRYIDNYHVCAVPAKLTVFPPLLARYVKNARLVHTVPEYGDVFLQAAEKSVVTFHNYFWDEAYFNYCQPLRRLFYKYVQKAYVKRALIQADVITTVSDFTANLISSAFPGVSVKTIYNGVDVDKFKPIQSKEGRKIKVLFSGNTSRRKGGHILSAIADSLPGGVMLQVTGGPSVNSAHINHPNIEFLGAVHHDSMPNLYNQADMLLLPSYREGLSLSVLEAMASGLPVIGYDSSSMSELIVAEKGGILCQAGDVSALNVAIRELAGDPLKRYEMGQFNRARTERQFNQARMVAGYRTIFDCLQ